MMMLEVLLAVSLGVASAQYQQPAYGGYSIPATLAPTYSNPSYGGYSSVPSSAPTYHSPLGQGGYVSSTVPASQNQLYGSHTNAGYSSNTYSAPTSYNNNNNKKVTLPVFNQHVSNLFFGNGGMPVGQTVVSGNSLFNGITTAQLATLLNLLGSNGFTAGSSGNIFMNSAGQVISNGNVIATIGGGANGGNGGTMGGNGGATGGSTQVVLQLPIFGPTGVVLGMDGSVAAGFDQFAGGRTGATIFPFLNGPSRVGARGVNDGTGATIGSGGTPITAGSAGTAGVNIGSGGINLAPG